MTLSEALLHYFQGNKRYVVVWEKNSSSPAPFEMKKKPLNAEQFQERHLAGEKCLGFYVIRPQDDTCVCSCLDFDDHTGDNPEAVRDAHTMFAYLKQLGQHPVLERSQSGTGYHVWLFHEPLDAKLVRDGWKGLLSECALSGVEIYPKQDTVQHLKERLGNFIRYPLWNKSQFEDGSQNAQDALETIQSIKMTPSTFFESKALVGASSGSTEGIKRHYETEGLPSRVEYLLHKNPGSLLASRWQCDIAGMQGDKSRSAVAMAVCTELVRYKTPTPEIEAALRYWCQIHQYEKSDRWIAMTVAGSYDFAATQSLRSDTPQERTLLSLMHSQLDVLAQGAAEMIPSGVPSLDVNLGGGIMEVGELCILGARANSGKTAFSIETMDATTQLGIPSVFFSLEMSARSVAGRYLLRMGLDPKQVPQGSLKEYHDLVNERLKKAAPLDFQNVRHLNEIVVATKEYAKRGYKLAVIDYMGIIKTDEKDELRHYERIARTLAELSKDSDIGILLLHQFGRDIEKRGGGRPRMSDFRYAGEADADVMLGADYLYKTQPIEANKNRFCMHVLKLRNRGSKHPYTEIHFDPDRQEFTDVQF